ncbi:GSCOCG00001786001-RA-CDS [Cotesia congregata]|nr:GSCOCG00001786001-RA-CDS [Cotesia congregata]
MPCSIILAATPVLEHQIHIPLDLTGKRYHQENITEYLLLVSLLFKNCTNLSKVSPTMFMSMLKYWLVFLCKYENINIYVSRFTVFNRDNTFFFINFRSELWILRKKYVHIKEELTSQDPHNPN